MEKKYSQDEIRRGFKNLARLSQENTRLKVIIKELQQEVVLYRAREVAAYMESIGYNDREASAALGMLKKHIKNKSK